MRLLTGRFDFFSKGVTWASLNDSGNVPDSRDQLIIVVMGLIKISNKALRMFFGIGSRSHDADFIMIFLTSSSDAGSKLKRLFPILGFWTDGTSFTWFEKLARIFLIPSQNYFAKCSQKDFTLFDSGSAAAGVLCIILLMVSQRRRGFYRNFHLWDLKNIAIWPLS